MVVRTLEYSVGIDGIIPAVELFAGTQGDIKATKLSFNITKLQTVLGFGENIYYRFDSYNAEGKADKGVPLKLKPENAYSIPDIVTYTLPESLTRQGGRICVYLVITQIVDGGTEMELYSFPARMRLNSLPQGGEMSGEEYESLTTLAADTKRNAEIAEQKAESAEVAAKRAETAAEGFTSDHTYIFDGGDESAEDTEINLEFELVATDEVKENSGELLTSGGAYKLKCELTEADNELREEIDNKLDISGFDETLENSKKYAENIEAFRKDLLGLIYPIGSVVTFHDNEDHSTHLGFVWEPLAVGKTLVGYNSGDADFGIIGKTGGEKEHTLTVNEMPSHTHKLVYSTDNGTSYSEVDRQYLGRDGTNSNPKYLGFSNSVELFSDYHVKLAEAGGGKTHNNMPPYIVTSFWIRTK